MKKIVMEFLDSLFGNDRNNLAESLIKAVTLNNYDETINLIKLGADLSYKNERSLTALHVASFRNNLVIVEKLLEHGADINVQDKFGATPLITATIEGHTEVVKYLIKSNADIFIKDTKGRTALKIALEIEYSNYDDNRSDICIELISACDTTQWEEYYDEAEYALIRASEAGNVDVVKKLINAGMFLDFQDGNYNDRTALICSVLNGHTEIAKLLIQAGANPDIQSDIYFKFSAIGWASFSGYEDIIDELIKVNANLSLVHYIGSNHHTPLLEAIEKEHENIAIKLIVAGADIEIYAWNEDSFDEQGNYAKKYTPLMLASVYGNINVIKKLLEYGASIDYQDSNGYTALMFAASNKELQIMEELKKIGANTDMRNKNGESAFDLLLKSD